MRPAKTLELPRQRTLLSDIRELRPDGAERAERLARAVREGTLRIDARLIAERLVTP